MANVPPEGLALLDAIAGTESPGYDVLYGGGKFSGYGDHPRQLVSIQSGPNAGLKSSAAGRYQFLQDTWDEAQQALGLPDFSPESQDEAAWWLAQRDYAAQTGRNLQSDLADSTALGGIAQALAGTWTSLPGGIEATTTGNRFANDYLSAYQQRASQQPQMAQIPSREDFLKQLDPTRSSAIPGMPLPGIPSREDFLRGLGGLPAEDTSPVMQEALADASRRSQALNLERPLGVDAEQPGILQQALGNVPVIGPVANLITSDSGQAFGRGAIDAIPIAGQALANARVEADALLAQLPGGMTPDEVRARAAAYNAALKDEHGAEMLAGNIAGTVLPFVGVGATALGAKALGMSADATLPIVGNLGARMLAGAGSGAVISGADTLAREGLSDEGIQNAKNNALLGGAIGLGAPVAGNLLSKGASAIKDAFLGASAQKTFARAMTADQLPPAALNKLIGQAGEGAVAADLGTNMQHLAGGLASLPGEPQAIIVNALTSRAAKAGNRLSKDVAAAIGEPPAPLSAVTDQIVAAQKAAAGPLYAAVQPVAVEMTPAIQAIQASPMGQAAFKKAAEMAANDGLGGTGMTVGFLDYAKQALDDVYGAAIRAGQNNEARQAASMARALAAEVDSQVPQYAAARDAFAGPAKLLDAIELGQSVFTRKMTPDELQSLLNGMSTSEKDGLLQGVQGAIQEIIGNARTDAAGVKALFASSNAKEKLALLLGPEAADGIEAALAREAKFSRTHQVAAGNSETAARSAQQAAISPELAGIPKTSNQTVVGMIVSGMDKARNALTSQYRGAQNVKLANMLTSGQLAPTEAQAIGKVGVAKNALLAPAVPALLGTNGPLRIVVDGANPLPVQ